MQAKLRKLAGELREREQHTSDLMEESSEIRQFVEHLTNQLASLSAADELSEKLGTIEFQYCPACLRPLNPVDGRHCIVCHETIDADKVKSKYFEIKIDTELQITRIISASEIEIG
jgi:hypothetical protein